MGGGGCCVHVCGVRCVCVICGVGGQLQPGRRGSQGEQGASWSLGPPDLCHRKGLCCGDGQTETAVA